MEMDVKRERSIIQAGDGAVDHGEFPPDLGARGMWDAIAVLTCDKVRFSKDFG
jgi:hypothetical protein